MATRGGPGGECVSSAFNISLTRIDLCTFVGLNWLNDNVRTTFHNRCCCKSYTSTYLMV